jgi:hypothetical protein
LKKDCLGRPQRLLIEKATYLYFVMEEVFNPCPENGIWKGFGPRLHVDPEGLAGDFWVWILMRQEHGQ